MDTQTNIPILTRKPKGTVIAVMPAWNVKAFLQKSIASARSELRNEDDLLIIDNGSTDGSFEYIKNEFPDVAILRLPTNTGGAGGFNAGIEKALECEECKFIWLLDSDTIIESGALKPLLDTLDQDEKNAAAGSQICLYNQPDVIQEVGADVTPWFAQLKQHHRGQKRLPPSTPPYPVGYLAACSLLVKAETIREVGPFRSDFFVFYDDVEWGLRVGKAGKRLMAVPASIIRHNFSATKPTQPWREYYRTRNRAICLALHPPKVGKFLVLWAQMSIIASRVLYARWAGDDVLSKTYESAQQDLLTNTMGAKDLKNLQPPSPEASEATIPKELLTKGVLIDIPDRVGNALSVAQTITTNNLDITCHIQPYPGYQDAAQDLKNISFLPAVNEINLVIVGEAISKQATDAPHVYRFRTSGFLKVEHPTRERAFYHWNKVHSTWIGALTGLIHAITLMSNKIAP